MKDLFISLCDKIKTIPSINTIDEDFGQIDIYEITPPVRFPAVLIHIDQQFESLGGGAYDVSSTITIRVAFDRVGDRTAVGTPDAMRNKSLLKLDIAEAVKNALNGYEKDDVFSALILKSMISERRNDALDVKRITFTETHEEYQ